MRYLFKLSDFTFNSVTKKYELELVENLDRYRNFRIAEFYYTTSLIEKPPVVLLHSNLCENMQY